MAEEGKVDDLFGSDDGSDDGEDYKPSAKQSSSGDGGQAELEDQLEDDIADDGVKGAAQATNLFGSDEEDEEEGDGKRQPASQQQQGNKRRGGSEDGEEEGDDEERQGHRGRTKHTVSVGAPIDVQSVLLPVPPPGSLMLLRTSNIMGIQPRAFDPATFEVEQELYEDSTGKQRVRLAGHAVVRWRTRRLPDGREVRESNARIVRWEDGSIQLLLGDEVLDVAQQDMRANSMYLFKQVDGMLQGQGALTTKVALRPASLDSGLHKRLREMVDKKHGVKKNKVELATGLANPELEIKKKEQAVEEKIRGRTQLAKRQDRSLRAYGGGTRGARPSRLSNQYLEEEQEWEGGGDDQYDYDDGLTADQRARLNLVRNRTLVDDNAEADMGRRLQAAKKGGPATRSRRGAAVSDDEEEDEEEEEEVEDEEEDEPEYESSGEEDEGDEGPSEPAPKKSKTSAAPAEAKAAEPKAAAKPRRRGVVLSDDEDDE